MPDRRGLVSRGMPHPPARGNDYAEGAEGGIRMPSRICETNGWLPNSKKDEKGRKEENRRYQSGKVTGHT